MNAKDYLSKVKDYRKNLEKAMKSHVDVGLPREVAQKGNYGNGVSVVDVGYANEYGAGVPTRSFLRNTFHVKKKEIAKEIDNVFSAMVEGSIDSQTALGRIGVTATNYVKQAFSTQGYGTWQANAESTIAKKGSSSPLIDTGALRQSITYAVRGKK